MTGPYHRVVRFLSNIGSLSRIVAPINVALSTLTAPGGTKAGGSTEQALDLQFDIQTYVAKGGGRTP
jgi:Tfp pilus assembly protein PilO